MAEENKQITITLNMGHFKKLIYILIVLLLIAAVVFQYYFPNCSRCAETADTESNKVTGLAVSDVEINTEEEPAETFGQTQETSQTTDTDKTEVVEEQPVEEDSSLLPITGKMDITIDDINYVVKSEDYARVNSVKFTIINQDKDFTPKVEAFLLSDETDVKDVTLTELKAGEKITKTESKLTFGFNSIKEEQTLKLNVYNEQNKVVTFAIKKFTVSS